MDTERTATINLGGEEYTLLLTTKATKEISRRYGGLQSLGDKLMKSKDFEKSLDEIIWLITLLANQSVRVHNLKNKERPRDLLTEDETELLTSPANLVDYRDAIMEALYKGAKRNVESEPDTKNTQAG